MGAFASGRASTSDPGTNGSGQAVQLVDTWISGFRYLGSAAGRWLIVDGRSIPSAPPLTPEACLSQRSQWHVECVDEAGRLIGQPHVALELLAERLDQACPETAPFGSMDCRAVPLGPCQVQALGLLVQCPGDVDASLWHRQGAELRGVRADLVERHRDGNDGARRHLNIGSRNREFRFIRIVEGFGGAADDLAKIGAAPSCLQKEIVSFPERQ